MQVNTISSNDVQTFGQKKEYKVPEGSAARYHMLEALANADNRQLQELAYKEASIAAHDKTHKNAHRAVWYSLPFAAGLAAVVSNPAKASSLFSKRMNNIGRFAGVSAGLAVGIGLINAAFSGIHKLVSSNETTRKFDQKHPFISIGGMIGAAYGLMTLGGTGITKAVEYATKHIKPETVEKALEKVVAVDKKLVSNGVLNSILKFAAKTPAPIKSAAKSFAPWLVPSMIVFDFAQSVRHSANKNEIAYQKYDEFKAAREEARAILNDIEQPQPEDDVKAFKNIDVEDTRIETDDRAKDKENTEE